MIYFDNAATTGVKPEIVIKSVDKALKEYSSNPGRSGHTPSLKSATAVYNTRLKIAEFFGCEHEENVVFTMNCTHSLNCIIKGVLNKGDHIIISSLEHNAVMRPLIKTGIDYSVARVSLNDDKLTLNEFEKKIKPNTKLILCTGASNVLGKILPIKEIGNLCHQRGILFAVDAAQTAGVVPINMKEMHIDYLAVAPHKGLYAPMGIGILICNKKIENTIIEGGTGTESNNMTQPNTMPERMESGTINVPLIMGINAGIDFVKSKGIEKIYNHEFEICEYIYSFLKKMPNIILYTDSFEKYQYAPVISFNIKNIPSGEVSRALNASGIAVRSGLHCAPTAHKQINTLDTGTVRISVSAFNSLNEASIFINTLKNIKLV